MYDSQAINFALYWTPADRDIVKNFETMHLLRKQFINEICHEFWRLERDCLCEVQIIFQKFLKLKRLEKNIYNLYSFVLCK